MAEELDVDAMIKRFRERAQAVKNRPLPPVEGAARREFMQRAQVDFQDFAMLQLVARESIHKRSLRPKGQ